MGKQLGVMCDCFGVMKKATLPRNEVWRGKHKIQAGLYAMALYKSKISGRCFIEWQEETYEKKRTAWSEIRPEAFDNWHFKFVGRLPAEPCKT